MIYIYTLGRMIKVKEAFMKKAKWMVVLLIASLIVVFVGCSNSTSGYVGAADGVHSSPASDGSQTSLTSVSTSDETQSQSTTEDSSVSSQSEVQSDAPAVASPQSEDVSETGGSNAGSDVQSGTPDEVADSPTSTSQTPAEPTAPVQEEPQSFVDRVKGKTYKDGNDTYTFSGDGKTLTWKRKVLDWLKWVDKETEYKFQKEDPKNKDIAVYYGGTGHYALKIFNGGNSIIWSTVGASADLVLNMSFWGTTEMTLSK